MRITAEGIEDLASRFGLIPYPKEAGPYAQWEPFGPAGTITDDTRFKMIFFNTLRNHPGKITRENFAREVLNFRSTLPGRYQIWYDRWIREVGYATRWVLGEREMAYPPARLWGAMPTMAGQMPFLCVAALYPGKPKEAYL